MVINNSVVVSGEWTGAGKHLEDRLMINSLACYLLLIYGTNGDGNGKAVREILN